MTWCCTGCAINWYPYQCRGGACPTCGGGTVPRHEAASPEAVERHKSATARSCSPSAAQIAWLRALYEAPAYEGRRAA